MSSFSYPFGDWGNQSTNNQGAATAIRSIIENTYALAFRQVWEKDGDMTENYPEVEDPYDLRRFEVPTDWTGKELVTFLSGADAKQLPYGESFSDSSREWKYDWGAVAIGAGRLGLSASTTSTGAFVFLDGTRLWEDYRYEAHAGWSEGSAASLIVRYQEAEQYASCTFSEDAVTIEERNGDTSTRLATSPGLPSRDGTLAAEVQGNLLTCFFDGTSVASARIRLPLSTGGIGLRVWDETPGAATFSTDALSVTAL